MLIIKNKKLVYVLVFIISMRYEIKKKKKIIYIYNYRMIVIIVFGYEFFDQIRDRVRYSMVEKYYEIENYVKNN